MRLIATMGASMPRHRHTYTIDDKSYETYFAFQAVAQHYAIADDEVFIVGTKGQRGTFDTIGSFLQRYNAVEIDSDAEAKSIFALIHKYSTANTVLDLTQGFRHIPMMSLLSAMYAKNGNNIEYKNILYGKTKNAEDNPYHHSCSYIFVSLMEYVDISDMATVVETFMFSAVLPKLRIKEKRFQSAVHALQRLSNSIFANDIVSSIKHASLAWEEFEKLRQTMPEFQGLSQRLFDDLDRIIKLQHLSQRERMHLFARYLFDKNLLLQAVTVLFESMLAYLEEEALKHKLYDLKLFRKDKPPKSCLHYKSSYERRNCLKKTFRKINTNVASPIAGAEFQDLLKDIDAFRNNMAHAFIDKSFEQKPKPAIRRFFSVYEKIIREKYE